MDMWYVDMWILGEAATKFCRQVMRRQQGVSWRGDWFMGTDITDQIQKLQKNNFFVKFLDSILLSEKQPWVFLLFGSHMRRVQASNSLGCYFFIEVCRCMNSKFHLDHVALHIFKGYPPFKILPPNGGVCFKGRASRKHHQTWQDSKSPSLERHLANQTSATLGIFCGLVLVIRWWSMISDMEGRMIFHDVPSKSSSLRDPGWTQRVTGYSSLLGTVAGTPKF